MSNNSDYLSTLNSINHIKFEIINLRKKRFMTNFHFSATYWNSKIQKDNVPIFSAYRYWGIWWTGSPKSAPLRIPKSLRIQSCSPSRRKGMLGILKRILCVSFLACMNRSGLEKVPLLDFKFFCCSFDFIWLFLFYQAFHTQILEFWR